MRVLALLSLGFCLHLLPGALLAPDPPSTCNVMWTFRLPCKKPLKALVKQMRVWSSGLPLHEEEKCMYEIVKVAPTSLEAYYVCPWTGSLTAFTFSFLPPAAPFFCKVKAFSTASENNTFNEYCLLQNLMQESGLTEAEGYREICNDVMCPAKAEAICDDEE